VLTGHSAPPAAAHDRVHRLGQTHDVEVTRFVVSDSVEERILEVSNPSPTGRPATWSYAHLIELISIARAGLGKTDWACGCRNRRDSMCND
jgi:hypothetical protein